MSTPLVTKAQLAALANVSRAHITQETRPGGAFSGAMAGSLVDLDHPSVARWLKSKGVDPTAPIPVRPKPAPNKKRRPPEHPPISEELGEHFVPAPDVGTAAEAGTWASMTLTEISRKFGGEPQFTNWLKSLALVEEIRKKRLDNEETERSLISRELVEKSVLSLLEEQNQRLLHELPRTIARQVQAQAKAGQGLEESERDVRKLVGQTLDGIQKRIVRRLKAARKK